MVFKYYLIENYAIKTPPKKKQNPEKGRGSSKSYWYLLSALLKKRKCKVTGNYSDACEIKNKKGGHK